MSRKRIIAIALSLLIVGSGCIAPFSGENQGTSESTKPSDTTETPQTTPTCTESTVPYNLSAPSRPENLTKKPAVTAVEEFDKRFEQARAHNEYDNVTVKITGQDVTTERIERGFKITITTSVQVSGTDDGEDVHAKYGYPTTYRITDRMFKREGVTFSCW